MPFKGELRDSRRSFVIVGKKEIRMKRLPTAYSKVMFPVLMLYCFLGLSSVSSASPLKAPNWYSFPVTALLGEGRTSEMIPQETPDPANGVYLGLGEAANGGDTLNIELSFPQFIDDKSDPLMVNLYLMVQLPDGYMYFLGPDGHFSSGIRAWRKKVVQAVHETVVPPLPLVNPITGQETFPPGTYTFYTLVVPGYISEDLSDIDWNNDPLNLGFVALEITPFWFKP
jgi:hypothetical protein